MVKLTYGFQYCQTRRLLGRDAVFGSTASRVFVEDLRQDQNLVAVGVFVLGSVAGRSW